MSVLDRYKVPYNELNKINPAWKEDMDHFFSYGLPDLALFINNGIVPACNHEYGLQFIPSIDKERKMYATIKKWNEEKNDPNIEFIPGGGMYEGQNPNTYFPTFRIKGYFSNEESLEHCIQMMWEHVEHETFYFYTIQDKKPVTEFEVIITNLSLTAYDNHRKAALEYYKIPFAKRQSEDIPLEGRHSDYPRLDFGPCAIIERPFKFPFKEIKTEEEFGTRMWMTLVNHLPEIGKENDYDSLKKEMYRQHSIEVMLQQAFRQLDRYLSREHMDPLGEWRNELDEQLTNGTAGSGALMQLFTYYGKNKDKNLSDEANWDKAIAHFLLERERAAAELKNRDEF